MMENITNIYLRKILSLDTIDDEIDVRYRLFPNRPRHNYVLIGPSNSGRTSLLFELAFQLIDNKSKCLYLTSNKIAKLPHLIGRERPSMLKLKSMEIVYPKTLEMFYKFLASLHRRGCRYNLIIVDDFDGYFQPITKESSKTIAMMSAMLFDVVSYLRKIGCETSLICSISVSSSMDVHVMNSLRHWFDSFIYFYRRHNNDGYVVKTQYSSLSSRDQSDTDAVPVVMKYDNNKIHFS